MTLGVATPLQSIYSKLNLKSRLANIALGGWVVASAFIWRDRFQFTSTVVTGVAIAVVAAIALLRVPWLRVLNSVLAMWLFWAPVLGPMENRSLFLNQWVVSLAVLTFSFLPWWEVDLDEVEQEEPERRVAPLRLVYQH
jgi:hypothetical protein